MTDYEITAAKIRQLPEPLLLEVNDFVDFLLAKHTGLPGQNQLEAPTMHPAMAAFGLWRDETDLESLTDEIYANRDQQGARPEVTP